MKARGVDETFFNPGDVTTSQQITVGPNDIITCDVNNERPEITLDKTTTTSDFGAVGDDIDYMYEVTNTGTLALAGPVSIDDDKVGIFVCGDLTTIGNNDNVFDPGEVITVELDD